MKVIGLNCEWSLLIWMTVIFSKSFLFLPLIVRIHNSFSDSEKVSPMESERISWFKGFVTQYRAYSLTVLLSSIHCNCLWILLILIFIHIHGNLLDLCIEIKIYMLFLIRKVITTINGFSWRFFSWHAFSVAKIVYVSRACCFFLMFLFKNFMNINC